jgi:hypothetical protein
MSALTAAVLAHDVRTWRNAFAAADARFEVGAARETWRADERLPAGRLLAVDDDRRVREAFARSRRAFALAGDPLRRQEAEGARGEAERALAWVAAGSGPAAAQANVLLGVLAADQPQGLERAVRAFEQALRLDASNTEAKFDLELALRVLAPVGVRPGEGRGRGAGQQPGAGAGEAGGGY